MLARSWASHYHIESSGVAMFVCRLSHIVKLRKPEVWPNMSRSFVICILVKGKVAFVVYISHVQFCFYIQCYYKERQLAPFLLALVKGILIRLHIHRRKVKRTNVLALALVSNLCENCPSKQKRSNAR